MINDFLVSKLILFFTPRVCKCELTCGLRRVVEDVVIICAAILQLLLFLQQSHAHQVECLHVG